MRIGEKRVALEPDNLDAAKLSLKAAETKGNVDDIAKWADCTWKIASLVASKGGRTAADAEQTKLYAESNLYSTAERTEDPATRLQLLLALQERNPKSPFAENIPIECIGLYKKLNQMDKALALAEQTLTDDPENVDVLMIVAESHFAHEDHPKVVADAIRLIDILDKRSRPASLSEEEWQKKRCNCWEARITWEEFPAVCPVSTPAQTRCFARRCRRPPAMRHRRPRYYISSASQTINWPIKSRCGPRKQ